MGSLQLLLNIRLPSRETEGGDSKWLLALDEMDAEDKVALMDGPELLFADVTRCLVYCDLFPASNRKGREMFRLPDPHGLKG